MFEHLTEFDVILVTGPQRSGTRIAAKMIAQDTGYEYVDEVHVATDSLYHLGMWMRYRSSSVIQCPALMYCIENFSYDNTAIVIMKRDEGDIIASQERIGWEWEWLERIHYSHYQKHWPISRCKYAKWNAKQVIAVEHSFEVEYESLSEHPLWVPKENRANFHFNQTREDEWVDDKGILRRPD